MTSQKTGLNLNPLTQPCICAKLYLQPERQYQKYYSSFEAKMMMAEWSFITNHGLVLAAIASTPARRPRAGRHGGRDRAHRPLHHRGPGGRGLITKTKVGRKNKYTIHPDMPLSDEVTDAAVGELLVMLGWKRRRRAVPAAV